MVYERDPKTGRKCKKGQRGRWYYYFTIDGIRYGSVIPAATNKKEAQVAEAKARAEIFEGTYAPRKKLGRAIFSDFVWIEEKEASHGASIRLTRMSSLDTSRANSSAKSHRR
jgi:hypothetical protein